MPNFNRRGFLQMIGAAGLAPLLPALPGRAALASAGASHSKALWAGIYAKSGSAPKFVTVARSMGLRDAAIRGVSARSVGVRVSVAAVGRSVSGTGGVQEAGTSPGKIIEDIERVLMPEEDVPPQTEDREVEAMDVAPTSPKQAEGAGRASVRPAD